MTIALTILIAIHAAIHFMGFLKAFRILPLTQLSLQISQASGVLWLLTGIALLICVVLIIAQWSLWWGLAFAVVALSQFLIFQSWSEAKFGTIPNISILVAAIVAMGSWSFDRHWQKLRQDLFNTKSQDTVDAVITEDDIRGLPVPVQNWLRWTNIKGRPKIKSVYLIQKGFMRLKPEQRDPLLSLSEQLISPQQHAFIWKVRTQMFGLPVLGRDMFYEGKGSMWISLFGLIPVVNTANNPKTNQSALQRFLGEIIWVPSAALHPSIVWKDLDEHSVEATMTWAGTQGSAIFYFHPDGRPYRFAAQRFKDIHDEKPLEWVADIEAYREFEGLKIPSKVKATWMLPSGPFTWFEFEIEDAKFN